MTPSPEDRLVERIRLYRETLSQTRSLFIESGELIRGSYAWLGETRKNDAQALAEQMDDLHRGFVMKVFATVLPDASADSIPQRQLGRVLLEHIWGTSVMGHQLHEAVSWLIDTADDFSWSDLVRPFAEIPAIRDRWGELETLAMRMAKLLSSVDGPTPTDPHPLAAMQQELDRMRGRAPEHLASEIDTANAREAIAWLRSEAERLRGDDRSNGKHETSLAQTTLSETSVTTPSSPPAAESVSQRSSAAEDPRTAEERLDEACEKLNRLIGLEGIKEQIQTLTNFLRMERHRQQAGLPTTTPSLHMAFVGNPGTGKTTVARIVAEIYGALGILKQGQLVETDRSGLVAEYAGQTGPKTNAKIDEALDGVLFIDEAYTLTDDSGQDQYGREAVQTLLKRMEDQRDRLVVILAGYPHEMRAMIRSNPGLSSRVGTTMHFDDYSPEALCRIFELIASQAKYSLPGESRRRLLRGFTWLYQRRDRHFGNGRCSRNSFERSVRRLANRLALISDITNDLLTTLRPEDIEVDGVEMAHLAAMADQPGQVRVGCSECDAATVLDDQCLDTDVTCQACQATFHVDWGEPVTELPPADESTGKA